MNNSNASNEGPSGRLDAELDRLLDLPLEQREHALRHDYPDEPALRAELESLLRSAAEMGQFLVQPAQPTTDGEASRMSAGPLRLGAWRLIRRIGSGGMGEVFEARRADGGFEQRAAVKLLQVGAVGLHERFHAERRILARLEHPGIARLLDGGVAEDGRPWMAMEFVEGTAITAHCREVQASLGERLRLFQQICEAVAYAHRNLIVHRDLKPANILVDGERRVRLLDFGIAKLLDDEAAAIRTAAAPLTPAYAAPEQLRGGAVTTATDVYALGLLLFELLAGCRPWAQDHSPVADTLRAILEKPAPAASTVAAANPHAPLPARVLRGDLDAILAKALREEPAQRYATVDALKLDIERVQRGEAVAAREGARLYRLAHFVRRNRWALTAAAAVFVSLAIGLGATAWQAHRASIQRDIARRDLAREEALRYELTGLFRKAIAEHGEGPIDAKAMLDASARDLLRAYRGQPQIAGPLVITLADLYDALEDAQGAAALLEGYLSQAGADADAGSMADARQKLANLELLRGNIARAGTLLDEAQAYWRVAPDRYAEERLEGLGIRARLQRAQGDLTGAISTEREAIRERIALSGHDHRETAILYNSLAITLTAAGRLNEALAAYRDTSAIYRALGLGDGLDAQIVLGNTGTLELRTGDLRAAEPLLKGAFERERALAGDSAAVAAAMGYYGKLLSIVHRPEAEAVLKEAAALGARYAGERSPLALQNELFLGEAQLEAGELSAAGETLAAYHAAALEQYGPMNALTQRAALALARLDLAAGRAQAAGARLLEVVATLRRLGPPAEANLAEALVALGEVDLAQGRPREARAPLAEAVALREQEGPLSWDLAQARERLGEALAGTGDSGARALLQQAISALNAQLGAEHRETRRARRALLGIGV